MSVINDVVSEVMDMIDGLGCFAKITRGALGTSAGLCCEVAPSVVENVFLSKESYISLDLTINGKHTSLQTLSDTLNNIVDYLSTLMEYPEGHGFQIVDITRGAPPIPTIIGREEKEWIMAASVFIKVYRKENES